MRNKWKVHSTDHTNALRWIRHIALIHYMGRAYDPKHMLDIADLAAKALKGETIESFPSMKEVENAVEEKAKAWMDSVSHQI